MRYAGVKPNDVIDGKGICVGVYLQGCEIKCKGCHNMNTWDPNGGIEIEEDKFIDWIMTLIGKNGVQRNLSILGGDPFAPYNTNITLKLASIAKKKYPSIQIYVWTGYVLEDLLAERPLDLSAIDVIIDGPFIQEQKDLTLELRGSRNQRILRKGEHF